MNLNQRRPTGARTNPYEKMTKNLFLSLLKEAGLSLEVEKLDAGEWNERRQFSAGGEVLGVAFKGERVDWESMWEVVQNG